MRHPSRIAVVLAVPSLLTLGSAAPASAHQHRHVSGFDTTVGWFEEPAFAGFRNAAQFIIARPAEDADHSHEEGGEPVENAKLKAELIFGDRDGTERMGPLDLTPAFGTPGEYRAFVVPTRPGTYTFHITGTIGKTKIDEFYTSGERGKEKGSEGTFNDVRETDGVQFPAKDPSSAELSEKLVRTDTRLTAAASSADDTAGTALILGIVGVALGAVGLGAAVLGRRKAA